MALVRGSSSKAAAYCNVPQPRLICAEYFASQVVVEATLTQSRAIHDKNDPDGIAANVYTMNADQVLRGTIGSTFEVLEPNDSGRATFDWIRGKKYILFLTYSPLEGSWQLDGCGNSGLLTENSPVLSEIEPLRHAHGPGMIRGLASRQELDKPVAGVHVEAKGAAGVYRAVTNETGAFRIQVPPGITVLLLSTIAGCLARKISATRIRRVFRFGREDVLRYSLFNQERESLHTETSQYCKAIRLRLVGHLPRCWVPDSRRLAFETWDIQLNSVCNLGVPAL